MRHALVTGGSGFIGSHLLDWCLRDGWRVTVVDNFDPFYDQAIKQANIASHRQHAGYTFVEVDTRRVANIDGCDEGRSTVRVSPVNRVSRRHCSFRPLAG